MGKRFLRLWSQWSRERHRKPLRNSEKLMFCYENTKSVCRLLTLGLNKVCRQGLYTQIKLSIVWYPALNQMGPGIIPSWAMHCWWYLKYYSWGWGLEMVKSIEKWRGLEYGAQGTGEAEGVGLVWSGQEETQRGSGCSKLKLQNQWDQHFYKEEESKTRTRSYKIRLERFTVHLEKKFLRRWGGERYNLYC